LRLVILTFALAASPYFILNTFEFGHPLKTGYDFWVPWFTEKQMMFSVHNVPRQLAMIWSEVTGSWDQFRVANLFGTGTYVVPTFVLLSVVGLAFVQFRRFEISALLAERFSSSRPQPIVLLMEDFTCLFYFSLWHLRFFRRSGQ